MPAMPTPYSVSSLGDIYGGGEGETGLTKREIIAMYAMQGLLSRGYADLRPNMLGESKLALEAVDMADALLKELSK